MNHKYSCYLYITISLLYYLQGILYKGGGIISLIIIFLYIILSGLYYIKVMTSNYAPLFIKTLGIIILYFTIYGLIVLFDQTPLYQGFYISQEQPKTYYLISIYISLLPIYAFYFFSYNKLIKEKNVRLLSVILIIITILLFHKTQQTAQLEAIQNGLNQEEFTNNISYHFLYLLPIIYFWRKTPVIQIVLALICLMHIFLGMKRGAILTSVLCIFLFIYQAYKSTDRSARYKIITIAISFIAVGAIYTTNLYNNNEYFQYRVQQTIDGNSSGRDIIYKTLVEFFINQDSIINIVLGNGAMYTIKIVGNFAHNDWLEILICNGILGIILYFAYFITLIKTQRNITKNSLSRQIIGMCIIILFITSIISMSYNSLTMPLNLCLGYAIANAMDKTMIKNT